MTNALLKEMLIALGGASVLLIVGYILRSKITLFQRLFLPSSVIGGFIGLLLGPEVLGKHLGEVKIISDASVNIWNLLPGILIIPIFAATPLGKFKKKTTAAAKKKKGAEGVLPFSMFFIMTGIMFVQIVIGLAVNLLFGGESSGLYSLFGFELMCGFVGGHGTAATVGYAYNAANLPYASLGQGVAITFATIGLLSGMLLGILFINIATRKGKTVSAKKTVLEGETISGIIKDIKAQPSLGRETSKSFAIESITLALALMFASCLLAYKVVALLPSPLNQIPVWGIALIFTYIFNFIMEKLDLCWAVDGNVVRHIQGCLTDFAITCAIAGMPLSLVAQLMGPIIVASVIGLIITFVYVFGMTYFCSDKTAPFEHSIIAWGTSTGVLMTGLMLLKICDPDFETPAQNNFATGFAIMSVIQAITFGLLIPMLATLTTQKFLIMAIIASVVFTVASIICGVVAKNMRKKA